LLQTSQFRLLKEGRRGQGNPKGQKSKIRGGREREEKKKKHSEQPTFRPPAQVPNKKENKSQLSAEKTEKRGKEETVGLFFVPRVREKEKRKRGAEALRRRRKGRRKNGITINPSRVIRGREGKIHNPTTTSSTKDGKEEKKERGTSPPSPFSPSRGGKKKARNNSQRGRKGGRAKIANHSTR